MISYKRFCFLLESVTHFEHGGAKGYVEDQGDRLLVSGIKTKKEDRGKGHAHELMKKITKHLDKDDRPAHLHPIPDDDTDEDRLRGFYRKHGFKDGTGMHRMRMERTPR